MKRYKEFNQNIDVPKELVKKTKEDMGQVKSKLWIKRSLCSVSVFLVLIVSGILYEKYYSNDEIDKKDSLVNRQSAMKLKYYPMSNNLPDEVLDIAGYITEIEETEFIEAFPNLMNINISSSYERVEYYYGRYYTELENDPKTGLLAYMTYENAHNPKQTINLEIEPDFMGECAVGVYNPKEASMINGIEVYLMKGDNLNYYARFIVDDVRYTINTNGVNKDVFEAFLLSIIPS